MAKTDFIKILQDIRGTQLTVEEAAASRDNIYGDITFMYNEILSSGAALNIDSIITVSDNIDSVVAIADDLNAIGGGNIAAVAGNEENINTVAGNIASVNNVSDNIANVNSVAANEGNINSVAGNEANIQTVVNNVPAISNVSNNIDDIQNVGNNIANVNAVGADLLEPVSEINTVAVNINNVETVANNITSVNSVATNIANVNSVAANEANINAVALNEADIDNVSANMIDIVAVSGNATNINQVAADSAVINDVASEPLRSAILGAESQATKAELEAWEAEAERLTAKSYADEPEDVPVNIVTSNGNGTFTYTATNPAEYSAFHWRTKAQALVSGGLANFSRYGIVTGLEITINAIDDTTYDIAPGEYYISDTLYTYPGSTGNPTGLLAGETLLTVGLDSSLNIVPVKDGSLSDDQRLVVVEIGALATGGGATSIVRADESGFKATNVLARLHVRTKNYIETIFDGTAAKVSQSSIPMQLDIASGTLNDAEMDSKTVSGATDVGGVEVFHDGSGNWITNAVATHVIDSSQYDNGTGLVAATAGRFLAIDIGRSSRTETVYVTKPQSEYVTFSQALNSPYSDASIFNTKGLDVVPIARVIVKVGDTSIRYIEDFRSIIPKLQRPIKTTEGTNNLSSFGNASIVETISTSVVSDGATVTFNYSDPNNSHLTCQFDEQNFLLSNGSVSLTAGTDTSPTRNFVYVELIGGVAQVSVSTSQFPATVHCPIAELLVPSASTVQNEGVYANQVWVNHMSDNAGFGHLHDINYWIRQQGATYISGMNTSTIPAVGGGEVVNGVNALLTAGVMMQLHKYTTSSVDLSVDGARVVNHPTTPFTKVFNLDTLVDANGISLANTRYNFVLLLCRNEDSTKLYINLPNGSYATDEGAINDSNNLSEYDIPAEFKGKTLYAARVTIRHRTISGGSYEVLNIANITTLASGSGGKTVTKNEYFDNEFKVVDEIDPTKEVQFQVSGVSTGTGRIMTIPDDNGTLALGTIAEFEAALNY